jgi:hypothetical protein
VNDEILWAKIQQHQGETFYTVRKKELVYEVVGDMLYHNLTSAGIPRSDFVKAASLNPKNTAALHSKVRGPSYVYAIITDPRIKCDAE